MVDDAPVRAVDGLQGALHESPTGIAVHDRILHRVVVVLQVRDGNQPERKDEPRASVLLHQRRDVTVAPSPEPHEKSQHQHATDARVDEVDARTLPPQSPAKWDPVPTIDRTCQVQGPAQQRRQSTRLQRANQPRLAVFVVHRHPHVRKVPLDVIVVEVVQAMG